MYCLAFKREGQSPVSRAIPWFGEGTLVTVPNGTKLRNIAAEYLRLSYDRCFRLDLDLDVDFDLDCLAQN